jgi:3-methylfumaryl-CoA hydratase
MQSLSSEILVHLQIWEGQIKTQSDLVKQVPVRAMAVLLNLPSLFTVVGAELPALWHWLFFLPCAPQVQLGQDGHELRGNFLPPVPLSRRIWAGGRLSWHAPLRVGVSIQRVSTIESVQHKGGKSGDSIFVTVHHCVHYDQIRQRKLRVILAWLCMAPWSQFCWQI